ADFSLVGVAGFEPATPWSQTRCANRTALHPEKKFTLNQKVITIDSLQFPCGEGGIRTPGTLIEYDSLANCWFQPLTHLSNDIKTKNKSLLHGEVEYDSLVLLRRI